MPERRQLDLPLEGFRLEEVNLPAGLVRSLAERTISVEVLPEEAARTRCVELAKVKQSGINPADLLGGYPLLIDPEGNFWNDWRPLRVLFTDSEGRTWRLPRRWLPEFQAKSEPPLDPSCPVSQEIVFAEVLNLPSKWDLWELNISWDEVHRAYRQPPAAVEVRLSPSDPIKVLWRDWNGTAWRIPHDWRRRRIKLPEFAVLASQGIPDDIAEEYAGKIVGMNYHPGSLCCLADQYRFRDSEGNRWPVRIRDCLALGYGDVAESLG